MHAVTCAVNDTYLKLLDVLVDFKDEVQNPPQVMNYLDTAARLVSEEITY